MIIEFTRPGRLSNYDSTEMAACIVDALSGCVERVDNLAAGQKPDMYSVYLHLKTGGCECVADFDNRDDALAFEYFLLDLVKDNQ